MSFYCFKVVGVLVFITIFTFSIFGQETLNCDSYIYKTKEQIFTAKFRGGGLNYKYLKRYVQQCSDSQYFQQAKELLVVALEENAEHNLFIAKYYLKQAEEHKSGIMGAYSRLSNITENYPQYSKMDEVLFLLVKADLIQFINELDKDRLDEAKKNYKRLLADFPFSNYVCEANKLFSNAPSN